MSTVPPHGNHMNRPNQAAARWLAVGAILAAVAVGMGAFAAHALPAAVEGKVTDVNKSLELWGTANRYLMYHSFGIMAVALAGLSMVLGRLLSICNWLFVVGIVLFSGCLFVMALTEIKPLGAIVPLGGMAWIVGWLVFGAGLLRNAGNASENGQQ